MMISEVFLSLIIVRNRTKSNEFAVRIPEAMRPYSSGYIQIPDISVVRPPTGKNTCNCPRDWCFWVSGGPIFEGPPEAIRALQHYRIGELKGGP